MEKDITNANSFNIQTKFKWLTFILSSNFFASSVLSKWLLIFFTSFLPYQASRKKKMITFFSLWIDTRCVFPMLNQHGFTDLDRFIRSFQNVCNAISTCSIQIKFDTILFEPTPKLILKHINFRVALSPSCQWWRCDFHLHTDDYNPARTKWSEMLSLKLLNCYVTQR